MSKKHKFVGETKEVNDAILHQIIACKDFGNVENAEIYGNSKIHDNAKIYNHIQMKKLIKQ